VVDLRKGPIPQARDSVSMQARTRNALRPENKGFSARTRRKWRQTRYVLMKIVSKDSDTVINALIWHICKLPQAP